MRKGIIVNLKRFRIINYVNLNKIYVMFCVLFIFGIIIGSTFLSENNFIMQYAEQLFKSYISVHKNAVFFKKFFSCLARYISIIVLYFLSGVSMLGVATTPFIILWQGISFGYISSYLYSLYGFTAISFNALVVIPPLIIFIICCFSAARYAIDFSISIAKLSMPKSKPVSLYLGFRNYCVKFLIYILVSLLCSVIEIVLNLLLLKFFNF